MARMSAAVALVVTAVLGLGGCGRGEDRPAARTGSGSMSGSGSGSGAGAASGTATHPASPSGAGGMEHGKPAGSAPAFGAAEADSTVKVTARDYAFAGIPATVKGPKVLFEVVNQGPGAHELVVVGADGEPVGELEPFAPGPARTLAVMLRPGAYKAQCLVKEGARTHAELGMETAFTVE